MHDADARVARSTPNRFQKIGAQAAIGSITRAALGVLLPTHLARGRDLPI